MSASDQPRSLLFVISEDEFDSLMEGAERRQVARGQTVLQKGDVNSELFVIQSGGVLVWESGPDGVEELARLGPGNFFGEMSVFCPGPASASVNAAKDSELLVLGGNALRHFLDEHPSTALKLYGGLLGELARRLRQTDADYFAKVQYAADLLEYAPKGGPSEARRVFQGADSDGDLFGGLSGEERERLIACGERSELEAGQLLLKQGQESRSLWLVETGGVEVRFSGDSVSQAVTRIPAGAFFGEISLFAGGTTSAAVAAAEATTVVRFSREVLDGYATQEPSAAAAVYRRMLEVLIKRTMAITEELTKSAFEAWL
jgi:CRP-like cAMP-binding protein